ncbi:MAG: hypothetical protein ABUL60_31620 [Myxococcales bacterium]
MPRIPDSERIERLLESEGGSLGRREIIEALGLSDERYEKVVRDMVAGGAVAKNRGRAGGLHLTAENADSEDEAPESDAAPESIAEGRLERDLYPAFAKYLISAARHDESKSVVLETHRTRARKWETPDLAEVRVAPFPMVGQWELRVAVYELKRQGGWGVESVLQAATYNEFAQESWLVVPVGDEGDWAEHFGKRVVDKAGDLGIGLGSFDAREKTLKKHMTPKRQVPSLQRQQEWLESVIDRLRDQGKKEEIAGHIRWARSKAESGRD